METDDFVIKRRPKRLYFWGSRHCCIMAGPRCCGVDFWKEGLSNADELRCICRYEHEDG